jgi:SP family arabinose:H+ symporter-like MFS transporter
LCAWAFFTEHFGIVPACIFAFIAAHAIGQGAVIWVFISEIFPDRYRAAGQSLGSATHWVFAALLTTFFPAMVNAFAPGWVFLFFTGMMVLQLVWVKMMVPETKGVPLEDIQKKLGIVHASVSAADKPVTISSLAELAAGRRAEQAAGEAEAWAVSLALTSSL